MIYLEILKEHIARFNFDVRLQLNLALVQELGQSLTFAVMSAFEIVLSTVVSSPPLENIYLRWPFKKSPNIHYPWL